MCACAASVVGIMNTLLIGNGGLCGGESSHSPCACSLLPVKCVCKTMEWCVGLHKQVLLVLVLRCTAPIVNKVPLPDLLSA